MWKLLSFIFLFSLAFGRDGTTCLRSQVTPILKGQKYKNYKFEKIDHYMSKESGQMKDNTSVEIQQEGCLEYIERISFQLPFGQTAPMDSNLLVKKIYELLEKTAFNKKYKNYPEALIKKLRLLHGFGRRPEMDKPIFVRKEKGMKETVTLVEVEKNNKKVSFVRKIEFLNQ